MKRMIIIFVAALTIGVCFAQESGDTNGENEDGTETVSGLESAACVFECLERFQRKGVDGDTTAATLDLEGSVCNKLDLDALVIMCSSYQKAGTCLGSCVNNPGKKVITNGLDYICVQHLEDFKKYMPCYKQQCPTMEQECGKSCGVNLDTAEDKWLAQLGLNNATTDEQKSSRKRRQSEGSTSDPETTTPIETTESTSDESLPGLDPSDPLYSCQFVRCYMNCSRPILEQTCGKDAYELLRQTSNILLSFVMVPLEETWDSGPNTSLSGTSSVCDSYFSEALTAEGVDRSVLKSSTTRQTYNTIWTVLLFTSAFMIYRF